MSNEIYHDIYLIRYLNGERNFRNEQTITDEYLLEAFFEEKQVASIQKIYTDRLKEAAPYALEYIYEDHDSYAITKVNYSKNDLPALAADLIALKDTLGGDDDTFDYFPDLIYAFQQICEFFKQPEIYNSVARYYNKEVYDHYDDPLPIIS